MVIKIMKQEALDILKSNLDTIYNMYYKRNDNKWLWDVCGGDPFIEYKTIPDFELASLDKSKGEIDLENCKIIFKNLMFITESQACDERLWAGLCHDVFYSYMRRRWNMHKSKDTNKEKAIGEIETRFFFKDGIRGGSYRNTLSKCWWVGRHTYDPNEQFRFLDAIGHNDMNTKINEIFHNYNFNANPDILRGILQGLEYLKDEGISYKVKEHLRPTLKYINAVGGGTLLDYWTTEEIKDLFVQQIDLLINGESQIVVEDDDNDDLFVYDVNISEQNEPVVVLGDRISIKNVETNKVSTFDVNFTNSETHFIPPIPKASLNHAVGEIFEVDGIQYELISINS